MQLRSVQLTRFEDHIADAKTADGPPPTVAEATMTLIDIAKTTIAYGLGFATIAIVALNGALKFAVV